MQPAPGQMSIGTTVDYTVRVLTHGEEVSGVTLSMSFDPAFLEVVDESGNPAGVIRPHQESPMGVAPSVNQVDNATGAIRYTIAASAAVSTDFDLAIVSFKAKKNSDASGPSHRGSLPSPGGRRDCGQQQRERHAPENHLRLRRQPDKHR